MIAGLPVVTDERYSVEGVSTEAFIPQPSRVLFSSFAVHSIIYIVFI